MDNIYQCVIAITAQVSPNELNRHQATCGKFKVKIITCIRKSYQRTDIEEICSQFYKLIPVVSHLEFFLPEEYPTPNNIGECLKGHQRQFWKECLFVQYYKNKNVGLILAPIPIKSLPGGNKVLCSLIATSIKEGGSSNTWIFVASHC